LRSPLNTLAILHEILRTQAPADAVEQHQALASAGRVVRNLDRMLERLRGVADSLATHWQPLPIGPFLDAAVAASEVPAGIDVRCDGAEPDDLAAGSCAERLPLLLGLLLRCSCQALPAGGQLRVAARATPTHTLVEVTGTGPVTKPPTALAVARLTPDDPGPADWFALASRCAGVAGELDLATTATNVFSVCIRLPLPSLQPTERSASC